jgi:REP element-mobilizing transposase RayT
MWSHLVAHASAGRQPLADPRVADRLWLQLRGAFPAALAAVLMPDHLHLLVPAAGARDSGRRLSRALGWLQRWLRLPQPMRLAGVPRAGLPAPPGAPGPRLWRRLPEPESLPDPKHLLRTVRYIHLNPCRDRLARDPLEWPWSTHRDVCGAAADPWVTPARLARALGRPEFGFAEWLHGYVSSDPAVHVAGTRLPEPWSPGPFPGRDAERLAAAVRAAWRPLPPGRPRLTRHCASLARLALRTGLADSAALARAMGVTQRCMQIRLAAEVGAEPERAVLLCLADARLRGGSAP